MQLGLFLPISGRSATRRTLMQAAQQAEAWGFSTVWAAERLVMPWRIDTPYPYAETATFFVPPDRPFLESLSVLAFLAGCTERIQLGVSVLVLPYRHPLHWAKVAATIDTLSEGRFILGVGIGWMREEFAALGAPFDERAAVADEQLELVRGPLRQEHASFSGRFYRFEDVAFNPSGYNRPGVPIWVGGEGRPAQRRAARYGDAWFPYFVRVTPDELAARFEYVRQQAAHAGREAAEVALHLNLPIEVTDDAVPQEPDRLRGSPQQLAATLDRFRQVGVQHLALQFMAPHYPERLAQITRFAQEVLPRL
jgi:probable F420-dependent oxidoreductase